ncbi:zinc-binding metallopeptidase family protein [Fimbriiglobus ruber]|uniref:Zinc-ribbon domain-containing protein n=1 Tax=Fimbriiglobus ruber TaxID=1908690 RepID=A0A225E4L5_9BACT|nr:putative zinc-binding peptidase [Fimbriiglobus ruber]OWK43347.1 hypothetical protein FRUB_02946 [Fimbriiglobus ruber]
MKTFHCDHCDHLVFFENTHCVKCNHVLAYLPDLGVVGSLDPGKELGTWTSPIPRAADRTYRLCANYTEHNVCNWAIPAADRHPLCQSCRLTRVIPDLSVASHKESWYKLEIAKRRLVYTLTGLGLPILNKVDDPDRGLSFEFLADESAPSEQAAAGGEPTEVKRVLTGHADGVITLNIAEANDAEREKRRLQLREPFRTLLGHFRHEVGHYYWDRLINDGNRLDAFRAAFGDERADYGEALKKHYETGAPVDWQAHCVSEYATAHPWEDWAETWAHYLHMTDTLETAASCGVSLRPRRRDDPSVKAIPDPMAASPTPFDNLMDSWFPVTYMLNNLNRGMGLPDGYPFVLSTPVIEKLRFIHDTIASVEIVSLAPASPPPVKAKPVATPVPAKA